MKQINKKMDKKEKREREKKKRGQLFIHSESTAL